MFTLSVYNVQLRNIGRAKCTVDPSNHTVGRATAIPAHYVPAPLSTVEDRNTVKQMLIAEVNLNITCSRVIDLMKGNTINILLLKSIYSIK